MKKETDRLVPKQLKGQRTWPAYERLVPKQKGQRTWPSYEYRDNVRLVPQKYLNAYPWASCRPSHHCFEDDEDLVVSFITLSSFSKEMAYAMLNKFLEQSLKSYEKIMGTRELLP